MLIQTLYSQMRLARLVNQTSSSFVTKSPTITPPTLDDPSTATGQIGFELTRPEGGATENAVKIVPIGVGSDDTTFSLRVIGWDRTIGKAGGIVTDTCLWVPIKLVEVQCTLGATVGVANAIADASTRFADVITLTGTSGNAGVDVDIVSPADDTIAHLVVDLKGSAILEITFSTGSSATSCNALWSLM